MIAPLRGPLATALVLAACAHGRPEAAPPAETGLASYYSADFQGRPTASGQPYDAKGLTCAHRSHPFGAALEVTNLENGRKVRVMVNDRGSLKKGRVVDVSREAARQLGMLKRGTARVRVVRVVHPLGVGLGQDGSVTVDDSLAYFPRSHGVPAQRRYGRP